MDLLIKKALPSIVVSMQKSPNKYNEYVEWIYTENIQETKNMYVYI